MTDGVEYPPAAGRTVDRVASARVPSIRGEFWAHAYRDDAGLEHLAYVIGAVGSGAAVLVRVHSECLTGDLLGSLRCDCGSQLASSLDLIASEGRGVLIYLRGHEGRGIGLAHKIRAYELQDQGLDTVEANLAQGLPADSRDYAVAAAVLADLGVQRVRLLTNNPAKTDGLGSYGVVVTERVPLEVVANPENLGYLQTKRDRLGHLLAIEALD